MAIFTGSGVAIVTPFKDNGEVNYEKHKVYLYKEDFIKFAEGLNETVGYIKNAKPEFFEEAKQAESNEFTLSVDEEFDI